MNELMRKKMNEYYRKIKIFTELLNNRVQKNPNDVLM